MRILNGVFCVLMLTFMAVQYNDPDGVFWMAIYAVPATWCALAACRPSSLQHKGVVWAYMITVLLGLWGVLQYWPDTPRFWQQAVWWETETAREGMGMMILFAALLPVGWVLRKVRLTAAGSGPEPVNRESASAK